MVPFFKLGAGLHDGATLNPGMRFRLAARSCSESVHLSAMQASFSTVIPHEAIVSDAKVNRFRQIEIQRHILLLRLIR